MSGVLTVFLNSRRFVFSSNQTVIWILSEPLRNLIVFTWEPRSFVFIEKSIYFLYLPQHVRCYCFGNY